MLLPVKKIAKPWGVRELPPPFRSDSLDSIGEILFEPPPAFPDVLIKQIFTSKKLSVQVHPSDDDTKKQGIGFRGKDECWFITFANSSAAVAIGFKKDVSVNEVREAAHNGSIDDLLVWHPVCSGDFFYIPAGTVHSIGEGIHLVEVQQASDITYRLFDYGRLRKLHLKEALTVAKLKPYDTSLRKRVSTQGSQTLTSGPYFELHYIDGSAGTTAAAAVGRPALILPLHGSVSVEGKTVPPGNCALVVNEELHFDKYAKFLLTRSISQKSTTNPILTGVNSR